MMLELNEVLVEGEPQTLSLMAKASEMTCLTGGSAERRTRWLLAMLGFQSVTHGYISIDGEPLTNMKLQKLMYYVQGYFVALFLQIFIFFDKEKQIRRKIKTHLKI